MFKQQYLMSIVMNLAPGVEVKLLVSDVTMSILAVGVPLSMSM